MKKIFKSRGFTLIEVLLVVAIIAILAGVVILAINPAKQLSEARNAQRWEDVNTILNAVYQYSIDNDGEIPNDIVLGLKVICKTDISNATCINESLADLNELTDNEEYITEIPTDPTEDVGSHSAGYGINRTANDRVTVSAPNAELGITIEATR